MGNHDTACITNSEVMKNGREMNYSMRLALGREFPAAKKEVETSIREFLLSQPLAVKTENRMWISHSLPGHYNIEKFDPQIMEKKLTIEDCKKPGSAYLLTWGRNINEHSLEVMTRLFDVDIFILGHQPQPQGWCKATQNVLILASDHKHGCLLSIELSRIYTIDELINSIVPLASVV
jgi:hypothetical protein